MEHVISFLFCVVFSVVKGQPAEALVCGTAGSPGMLALFKEWLAWRYSPLGFRR